MPNLPIRRINLNQMQDWMEKELYYSCDKKYQSDHRCNKPKLYLLEEWDLEEEEEKMEEKDVSDTSKDGLEHL
jgi:adenine specific DNA methylase Mod